MTRTAIYPGTFDPVTNGHMDIIRRSLRLVDKLVVAVATNADKNPLFDLDERIGMVENQVNAQDANHGAVVKVRPFHGLLVDLAREEKAVIIIRGLRGSVDYEYESQMTGMNRAMNPDVETVFLSSSEGTGFISSTLVRQIARLGGNINPFVPPDVANKVTRKLSTP